MKGMLSLTIAVTTGAVAWAGACGAPAPVGEARADGGVPSRPSEPVPARLPAEGTMELPFAPSLVRLVEGDPRDVERLADVEACGDCHADALAQWRQSVHAQASFPNPFYRAIVDDFRERVGARESRFCSACHEPAFLLSGATDSEIRPEDPLAHAGITCLVCHGIREARPDGNASFTLTTAPVPYPDPADPESIEQHRRRVAPDLLRSERLCGTCHRSFLGPAMGNPHHLAGVDDLQAWRDSVHAGSLTERVDDPVAERNCQGCHMSAEAATAGDMAATDGSIASHRFAGAHRTIARILGSPTQEAAVRRQLEQAATIDVAAVRTEARTWTLPGDGAPVTPGDSLEMDVVVRNVGAGHRFPGGTRDIQDTWIEVRVTDARGRMLGEAGTRHAHKADPTAHRLRAVPVDDGGRFEELHRVQRFRAVIVDRSIAPRDATVVRYRFDVPAHLAPSRFPLAVEARLRHRRHSRTMQAAACEATRSPRGRAFAAAARRLGRRALDGCEEQPITELARSRIWIGPGAEGRAPEGGARAPAWRRLFDHALGLTHSLQERLDEVRPSLERALVLLPPEPEGARPRAMVTALAAQVAAQQARLPEAERWLAEAERAIGPHPALARIRGEAHGQLWNWSEAAEAFGEAVAASPRSTTAWSLLAAAQGSAGADRLALDATRHGLALAPHHGELLRSQALAVAGLEVPDADAAWDAFLAHRLPDSLFALRARCDRAEPTCLRDRQPVPLIDLRRSSP